jgi:hypothetical protein
MCASPYISKSFFVKSLLDRRDTNDRETVSALVYRALSYNKDKKIVNLIDVNSRIAYPIIADQGYQCYLN